MRVTLLRSLPRRITRPISFVIFIAWVATMAVLVQRSFLQASSASLATDLARYGSNAQWRGVYYRNEKIGFTVSQTVATGDGFELQEDGRLQMSLLGATTAATIHTVARVDRAFALRGFEFSLDPGTGATRVRGEVNGPRMKIDVTTTSGTRSEERELSEPPVLAITMARRLADGRLVAGARHQWTIFDPATLSSAAATIDVGKREMVEVSGTSLPAFRVAIEYAGLRTTSWVTDTGEVVREESGMGLHTVRETPERARAMAVPLRVREDLLASAAVVPTGAARIDNPRDVRRLRMRLTGADLSSPDLAGLGQTVEGDVVELIDAQGLRAGRADPGLQRYLQPETFIESDAEEIRAEAAKAVQGATTARARAERLTRYVNALLDKKPTVSLPSAREVLRTKVGDCNEHTVLYVAMARAAGLPARIAVGLVSIRGAFYYHAWPEVYIDEGRQRGLWLPVDPTLNQFPADATHLRLARGGLDKQAAILPLIGRLKIAILDLELAPNTSPVLVGRPESDARPLSIALPTRTGDCWSSAPRAGRRQ